ncbi:mitogen-activated protein kinase-binding protein 1 [Plakobranchus ocellatus]|uniref:Mitogen-activated protein kinase-binding protein 1 n=1 Tax=Plakobranchus ocellatus TaxID=259542 RepID=A0AAV4AEB2_9GAST|nr:mitogen-activated protein kinase-binding protein 1 [Plakobranchus ocellatus]
MVNRSYLHTGGKIQPHKLTSLSRGHMNKVSRHFRKRSQKSGRKKKRNELGACEKTGEHSSYEKTSGMVRNSLRLTLGMTCLNRNCFAIDPTSGTAAYSASGVAVLLDTINCKHIRYIQASTQSLSCINFSPDGQYILLGEFGHMPALRVWSMALENQVAQFQGHEYGVAFAAFSGKMDLLVSVGINFDGGIFVWSWPSREMISCNRFTEVIYAMSFSSTDPFFVTCGSHHIRFWYPTSRSCRFETDTLLGRSVIMRDIKTRTYVDVGFGSGRSSKYVYTVTTCGLICKINSQRQITQFFRICKAKLSCVQAKDDLLLIATVYGHVHFFNALSMQTERDSLSKHYNLFQYRTTITMPVDAGLANSRLDLLSCNADGGVAEPRGNMYIGLDHVHKLLTAVLDNGDLCIWNVEKLSSIERQFFSSGLNKAVSGLDVCLTPHDKKRPSNNILLFSGSQDGTLRQWKLCAGRSVLCKTRKAVHTGTKETCDPPPCDTEVITAVKANPQLGLIVTGNLAGLVTVYENKTLRMIKLCSLLRHLRGVTTIMFHTGKPARNGAQLMLTGGRDRLINMYDIKKDFVLLGSLKFHSGSISALAMLNRNNSLMILSSALDRSVILSSNSRDEPNHFKVRQCRFTNSSVVDIQLCPAAHWAVIGRCNAMLSIIDTLSFNSVCTFRGCKHRKAHLEKLCVDTTGALLVTACSDRSINVLSCPLGLQLASFTGHATPVSGLALSLGARHIVSSSRDGCVFLWTIPIRARRRARRLIKLCIERAKLSAMEISNASEKSIKSSTELVSFTPVDNDDESSHITACSQSINASWALERNPKEKKS